MAQVQVLYVATANGLQQMANPGKSDRWRLVGDALTGQDVLAVVASPTDPLVAYAAGSWGLAQTTNGGASWDTVLDRSVSALAGAPDGAIYVGGDDGILLRSELGSAWNEVWQAPAGVDHLSTFANDQVIAVLDDGMTYLGSGGAWSRDLTEQGSSRVIASIIEPQQRYVIVPKGLLGPTGVREIDLEPSGALVLLGGKTETLLIATTSATVLRSDDGGATLTPIEGPIDVQVLVTPPHFLDYAYAGTSSGELWFTKDRGRSWARLHEGFAAVRDLSFARVQ